MHTVTNPIATDPDPRAIQHKGAYYRCLAENGHGVAICKSETLAALGKRHVVWKARRTGPHPSQIWAPELHFLDGCWHICAAASGGRNIMRSMIVLESATTAQLSECTFKAELYTGDNIGTKTNNRWAIDGTILSLNGKRHFVWSGWQDKREEQSIYAAPTGNHKLGLLDLASGDALAPGAWRKHPNSVFAPTSHPPGVGHGAFTKSPDGTQFWQVYHARHTHADGWERDIFAQPFTWNADGFPDFGKPVAPKTPLRIPYVAKPRGAP